MRTPSQCRPCLQCLLIYAKQVRQRYVLAEALSWLPALCLTTCMALGHLNINTDISRYYTYMHAGAAKTFRPTTRRIAHNDLGMIFLYMMRYRPVPFEAQWLRGTSTR